MPFFVRGPRGSWGRREWLGLAAVADSDVPDSGIRHAHGIWFVSCLMAYLAHLRLASVHLYLYCIYLLATLIFRRGDYLTIFLGLDASKQIYSFKVVSALY